MRPVVRFGLPKDRPFRGEPGAGIEPTSLLWPLSYPGEWQRPERRPPPLTHPQKTICPTTNTWVLRAGLVLPQPAASVANCSAHAPVSRLGRRQESHLIPGTGPCPGVSPPACAGLSRLSILFESFDGVVIQESKCGSPGQASGVAPDPGNRPLPGSLTACMRRSFPAVRRFTRRRRLPLRRRCLPSAWTAAGQAYPLPVPLQTGLP